jgi:Mce-associated membrane protein
MTETPTTPAADAAEPAPRRRLGGLLPVLALSLLAVLLLLTGYLGYQAREQSRADTARADALAAARDAARLLFSYDHTTLDEDFERGLAVTTGGFREEYERTTREVVRPVAEQYDAVVEADVVEAAVVSADPDRVVTVAFVNQTTTSTRVEGPKIDQSRVRMSLRKVDGTWLVDQVNAL